MADIFGAVVAAGQVMMILARYCEEVEEAKKDIQKLKDEILLVSEAMKQVEKLYEPVSSSEKEDSEFQKWVQLLRTSSQ